MRTSERTRLARARELGYLDARPAGAHRLIPAYSFWCWRLKLPAVWLEKRSPRSRLARVRLDMFTTASVLTARAQSELAALHAHPPALSAHDAFWDRVPMREAESLARTALRTAVRPGNHELNRIRRPARLVTLAAAS
jgi:hypothetical protein